VFPRREDLVGVEPRGDPRFVVPVRGHVEDLARGRGRRMLGGEPRRLPERAYEQPDLDASHSRRLRERRDARDGPSEDRVLQLREGGGDPDERLLQLRVGLEKLAHLRLGSDRKAARAVTSDSY
jgi:hypothetical protein